MFSPARVSPVYSPRVLYLSRPMGTRHLELPLHWNFPYRGFSYPLSILWYTPTVASCREYLSACSPVCPTQRLAGVVTMALFKPFTRFLMYITLLRRAITTADRPLTRFSETTRKLLRGFHSALRKRPMPRHSGTNHCAYPKTCSPMQRGNLHTKCHQLSPWL